MRTGVQVDALDAGSDGRLVLTTADGTITARAVVVSTGAYQRAHRPDPVAALPRWLRILDAADYRNPGMLPDGDVLVIGSGQTGCQLAEELRLAGRDVTLVCGRAPWCSRRLEGRDFVDWLVETPFFEISVADLPSPGTRLVANVQATGVGGGHDLHYRTLDALGVTLTGRLVGVDGDTAYFADDLATSVAFGDARYADVRALITKARQAQRLPVPEMGDPAPFPAGGAGQRQAGRLRLGDRYSRLSTGLPGLDPLPGRLRQRRLPSPSRRREHRRTRALFRRRPFPTQAEIGTAPRGGRGRHARRRADRRIIRRLSTE